MRLNRNRFSRWKRLVCLPLAALYILVTLHFSPAATAGDSSLPVDRVIRNALAPSPLYEDLRVLTDEIGGRVSGTPAMNQAVAWGVAAFHSAGIDVHTESYELPATWQEGVSRFEVSGTVKFPLSITSVAWAPSTPSAGIEAALVDVGEGTEQEFVRQKAAIHGSILVVHSTITETWVDLMDEYYRAPGIISRAKDSGAQAILWIGARDHRVLYRHTDAVAAEIAPLPMAIVAREDGVRLTRLMQRHPGRERGHLSLSNQIGGPVMQQNVVGEIRGRKPNDEIVVLGAHLDSWELGTGALDNGCNAALVIAAARTIRKAEVQPLRTLRFVLFSGEEQGLLGSRAYVKQHQSELDRIVAMITYDSGNGRVTGYSLGGREDIEPGVKDALLPLADWDVGHHTLDASPGTDNLDFLLEGIPTLVANQDASNYMVNYHAATDTLDKVDIRTLQMHVAIAAVTAFGIADRQERLAPRQSRQEVESLMQRTGLDKQLQTLGYWPDWQSGTRGRHP